MSTDRYPTWQQASEAAVVLGVSTRVEYLAAYEEDPRLPASPELAYQGVWAARGGWYGFLQKERPKLYRTWQEARDACLKLGISSSVQYRVKRKLDPRLPSRPEMKYESTWEHRGRWTGFLAPEEASENNASRRAA